MKTLLLSFLVLSATNIFSQQPVLEKLWVGNDNNYLLADATILRFEKLSKVFGNIRIAKDNLILGDTLRISEKGFHGSTVYSDFLMDTVQKGKAQLNANRNKCHFTHKFDHRNGREKGITLYENSKGLYGFYKV